MKYLLDTHIFLWTLFEPEKLRTETAKIIKNPENSIYVSTVTFWEISLKYALGKLELEGVTPEELPVFSDKMNFSVLDLSTEDAATFYKLPRQTHKDPFDRIIIWQAINNKLTLISKEKSIPEYQTFGLSLLP